MTQFSYLIATKGNEKIRNIALVHLKLNLFISKKSGVSQALPLRNVDKISHYKGGSYERIMHLFVGLQITHALK